jgi:hypothetical protein
MPDSVKFILLFPLVLALWGGFAWKILSPLGAVWRGDASRVPSLSRFQPQARTYLPFSLWVGAAFGGLGLVALAAGVEVLGIWQPRPLAIVGFGVFWAAGPLMLVNMFAWAFNRPKFLIVPAYRDHPGWVRTAVWRIRVRAEQLGARLRRSRQERRSASGS